MGKWLAIGMSASKVLQVELIVVCRIVHELLGALSKHEIMFMDSSVTSSDLGLLLDAITAGKITSMLAYNLIHLY